MNILQLRLKHCLQTILDMQTRMDSGDALCFENDFSAVRGWLQRVEQLSLEEADVEQVETHTVNFLAELDITPDNSPARRRLLN